ncbi:MAG: DUF2938 domain-containing protein [Ruminococcus sp.]|nr:DUF2938 domain-containing protein [Ruminococcus sp.]
MTEYLKKYMKSLRQSLDSAETSEELEKIMAEHKDKIAFMQHERLVHFLVTMMFAVILVIFVGVHLVTENILVSLLVVIITVLLGFYIKHYYFLENTVQEMYRIYDEINAKKNTLSVSEKTEVKRI